MVAILFGGMFVVQVVFKISIGNRPVPTWLLFSIFLLTTAFTVFMYSQQLKFKITSQAIYFSLGVFAPMQSIKTDQIASISLRKYNGVGEFSGWGVKSNATENCYTTSGDEGMEIKFKNNAQKPILIGTHKSAEVQEILSKYFSALKN